MDTAGEKINPWRERKGDICCSHWVRSREVESTAVNSSDNRPSQSPEYFFFFSSRFSFTYFDFCHSALKNYKSYASVFSSVKWGYCKRENIPKGLGTVLGAYVLYEYKQYFLDNSATRLIITLGRRRSEISTTACSKCYIYKV